MSDMDTANTEQGCPGSSCTYQSSVDKAGKTDRNWCTCDNNNAGEFPPACRPATALTESQPLASLVIVTVTVTSQVSSSQSLSISEQEVVQTTYKSQLETWYSTMSLVFTITLLSSRRSLKMYTLVGTAKTSNPSAASLASTPMLSNAFASELSRALPDATNSDVATSVTSKLESTEEDSEEDGGRGSLENEILIGAMLSSIAIASCVGFVVYREWSQR